jgi:hypothetical protein
MNLQGYKILSLKDNPIFLFVVISVCLLIQAIGGAPVFALFFKEKLEPLLDAANVAQATKISVYFGLGVGFIAFLLIEGVTVITHFYGAHKISKRFAYLVFFIGWGGYMTGIKLPSTFQGVNFLAKGMGDFYIYVFLTAALSGVLTFAIYNFADRLVNMEAEQLQDASSTLNKYRQFTRELAKAKIDKLGRRLGLKATKERVEGQELSQRAQEVQQNATKRAQERQLQRVA